MTTLELVQIILFFALLIILTPPLGGYMARVYNGDRVFLSPILRPVEGFFYRLAGVRADIEMNWKTYAVAVVLFNLLGFAVLFIILLVQGVLPLNPKGLGNVEPFLAFNTATSFVTNTNWQSYGGETTMTYFSQMVGLAVQNFLSAATGMAVLIALTRGLVRRTADSIGNFWVDLVRSTLYVLLPLSIVIALVLVSQGVVQNFNDYTTVTALDGTTQVLPQGPAASQIAIKQIGTNGGGFFNVNSAHPYENSTPLSNFVETLSILLIPAALTYTYGKMVGSKRQGWVIFAAMFVVLLVGLSVMMISEYSPGTGGVNPVTGVSFMEGKEVRFGITNSLIWGAATTVASNGSVNSMHSSFSALSGGIAMFNMMLGEVIFGGVGSGLYGMLIFVILTVFIAGLMVGRTPEYLGKKVESREIQLAIVAVLLPNAAVLLLAALAAVTQAGLASRANVGPHGLSEILYAFASASNNNGSAFAGLNANVPFFNALMGIAMWVGRFGVILPVLAIAGSMVVKKTTPPSSGTFPTGGPLFVVMLIAVVIIVGALTFFPALSLGPIVEQVLTARGVAF